MKIEKIKIEGFGLFNQAHEFNFVDDKINLICGNNETGKTTLLRGIIAGFFGLDKARWSVMKSTEDADDYKTEITFSDRDTTFHLSRNFETNEVILNKINQDKIVDTLFKGKASPQSRSEEKEYYYDILKKIIGLNNETLFKNVNVVYQRSIETKINKEIQHILTGALGTNYKTVQERWSKEYFDLTAKSAWEDIRDKRNEREIELLEKDLNDLENKKEMIQESSIKISQLEDELKGYEEELAELETDSKKKKGETELSKDYIDLIKEKKNLEEKMLFYNKEIEKYDQIKTQVDQKRDLINRDYIDVEEINDEITSYIKDAMELKEQLEEKRKDVKSVKKQETGSLKKFILSGNGIILAGLCLAAKFKFNLDYLLYVSIGLGLASVIFLIFSLIHDYQNRFQHSSLLSAKNHMIQDLQLKLSVINDKLHQFPNIEFTESYLNRYEDYKRVKEELDRLNHTLGSLNDRNEFSLKKQDLEKELISVNMQLKELENLNPGLVTLKDNQTEAVSHIENIKEDVQGKEERIEILKKKIFNINKDLASATEENESLGSIYYKIQGIQDQLDKLYDYRDAYKLVVDTLKESIKEYQEEHIDRLSRNISEQYKQITKGKHDEVILTDDFHPIVKSDKNQNIDNLSCGAEEQLYFAVRLALLREINDLTHLPLLLDDPFVNFDKDRLEVVKEVLTTILSENQIILFSHIKSYQDWDNIHSIKIDKIID